MGKKKINKIKKIVIRRKKTVVKKETFSPHTFKNNQRSFTSFRGLCKGCGICLEICPKKCIKWAKGELGVYKTPTVACDIDKCIACRICELRCPDAAITIEKFTTEEPLLSEPPKKKLLR